MLFWAQWGLKASWNNLTIESVASVFLTQPGQCWPRRRSRLLREWKHAEEGDRTRLASWERQDRDACPVSRWKEARRPQKAQVAVTGASGWRQEDGSLCFANTKRLAKAFFHVVHAQKASPIHSIKPPSRRGKWNLAWPLKQKLNKNHELGSSDLKLRPHSVVWGLSFLLSYITYLETDVKIIPTTRGRQWGLIRQHDQGLAFCLVLGMGSEYINYMPYCYVNLLMDTLRIWQEKVKLWNKLELCFSKASLQGK